MGYRYSKLSKSSVLVAFLYIYLRVVKLLPECTPKFKMFLEKMWLNIIVVYDC